MSIRNGVTVRGTTNENARGNSRDRAARRAWLVQTYRADVDVLLFTNEQDVPTLTDGRPEVVAAIAARVPGPVSGWLMACRCYRCGSLLTEETLTVDRIIPGCKGGTYRRSNIRPACGGCNSSTGGRVRS